MLPPQLARVLITRTLAVLLTSHLAISVECLAKSSTQTFVAPSAGEKLIEHLKAWLEPEKLAAQECAWSPGQAPEIAAAILELFHLLPPQAAGFLHSKGAGAVDCSVGVLPCCWHATLLCDIVAAPPLVTGHAHSVRDSRGTILVALVRQSMVSA